MKPKLLNLNKIEILLTEQNGYVLKIQTNVGGNRVTQFWKLEQPMTEIQKKVFKTVCRPVLNLVDKIEVVKIPSKEKNKKRNNCIINKNVIIPFPRDLFNKAKELTKDVDVDLNSKLVEED